MSHKLARWRWFFEHAKERYRATTLLAASKRVLQNMRAETHPLTNVRYTVDYLALAAHLWQAYAALRHQDYPHAEEHLKAAMNLADPGPSSGLGLISLEPCALTGENHTYKKEG